MESPDIEATAAHRRHPHRGQRWALGSGLAALVLVGGFAAGEATGWPFLSAPLEHWLSRQLDRRVSIGTDASAGAHITLWGGLQVRAPSLEIGAPAWSTAPHTLLAHEVSLRLAYADLWRARRGEPLVIRSLQADDLDARAERLADGRASWQFGAPREPAAPPAALPTFGELRVDNGQLKLDDAMLDAQLDARFALVDQSTAATPPSAARGGLEAHATGSFQKLPLKVDLTTTGALAYADAVAAVRSRPIKLVATVGKASLQFDGVAADAVHLAQLRGRFSAAGPSLAAVGDLLGVTLPTTAPFKTRGTMVKDGLVWKAVFDDAAIGESRLNGAFVFDRRGALPLLSGRLGGSRLVLADLGPVVGTPTSDAPAVDKAALAPAKAKPKAVVKPQGGKVLPNRPFDLPALRAMDANVLIDIAYLDLGTSLLEPLKPLHTHLQLREGVLRLEDLDARTAEGRLGGQLQLDGRRPTAVWTADLRLRDVQLERWLHLKRKAGAPPYITGRMGALVKVTGTGKSTADILGSLGGSIRLSLQDAMVSHLGIEAAGVDVAAVLGLLIKGDDLLRLDCNIADLVVDKGLAKPRVFVVDTRLSTIWVDGSVSLRNEDLALTAVVSPKDFSPFTLRTPLHVGGTFSAPKVSLDKGTLGVKGGAAALLALLNPLAAVLPFIDPGDRANADKEAAQCASLVQRGQLPKGAGADERAAAK